MGTNGAGLGVVRWRNELTSWGIKGEKGLWEMGFPHFLGENTKHPTSENAASVCQFVLERRDRSLFGDSLWSFFEVRDVIVVEKKEINLHWELCERR